MNLRSLLSTAALTVASLLSASQAQAAFVFTAVNQSYTTNLSGTYDGVNLSASITYTLSSFSTANNAKSAKFTVTVNNTTADQAGTNVLAGFGVSVITPTLTSVGETFAGLKIASTTEFDGTNNDVDLCLYSGGSCENMASSGVAESKSESGTITLGFGNSAFANGFSVSFGEPYYVRFVGVGNNNSRDETTISCTSSTACVTSTTKVPEPASLALVGLGLLAAGAARRRRA